MVHRENRTDIRVYIGGKTQQDILMKPELESMGARVAVSTEDGSMGVKGLVTEWLDREGADLSKAGCTAMFACGPLDMLARVATLAKELALPCQVSLETRMACGLGACLGCAVRTRHRDYRMVCKQGPTFDASEIDWEATKRLL
jgi:dihydroorotate dehydrogenase electron transfer subunit